MERWSGKACGAVWLAALGCGLSIGCVTMPTAPWHKEVPPTGPVTRILGTWENQVIVTRDTENGGRPLPGLAARLYLFSGDTGFPVQGDGDVQIDLYDVSNLPPGQQPKLPLERWHYDKDTLKRLIRKDMIGWGYTVFLPWSTYRPEINQVALLVSYLPEKGSPIYAPSFTMALNNPMAVAPAISHQRAVPGKSPMPSASLNPPSANSPTVVPPPSPGPTRITLPGSRNTAFGSLIGPK